MRRPKNDPRIREIRVISIGGGGTIRIPRLAATDSTAARLTGPALYYCEVWDSVRIFVRQTRGWLTLEYNFAACAIAMYSPSGVQLTLLHLVYFSKMKGSLTHFSYYTG